MEPLYAAVLAAGLGTRMRSQWPKVLHGLGGRPMLSYAVAAVEALSPARIVVVVGHGAEQVRKVLGEGYDYAEQREQLGTGHALRVAVEALPGAEGDLVVTYGDMPLLGVETLRRLLGRHRAAAAGATLLTAMLGPGSRFGRIVRDGAGRFLRIVEYRDANGNEQAIPEVNAGVYCFRLAALRAALPGLGCANAQGEYYLTDLFPLLSAAGCGIETVPAESPDELCGPNDRVELAAAEALLRRRINEGWMLRGVTMADPSATYIEPGVTIGRDTIILPGTTLAGRTEIGEGCILGPAAEIRDSRLGPGVRVFHSLVVESVLGPGERVGPFIHLNRNTVCGQPQGVCAPPVNML